MEKYGESCVRTYFSIRCYGDALPQFLSAHEDYAAAPVLAELARWEWTMTGVFDAADAAPLAHEALARVAPQQWAQLRFAWHPSVRRLALSWNVPQIWQALTADSERPQASLNAAPVQWLLWRHELTTYFRSLTHAEAAVLDAAPCQLFLKLENQNPGGSIKDRVGLYLVQAAERAGSLKPGGTLIEATAGNTGLGLALVAAQKGYRLLLVIPDKMSQEKIFHLKAMGADVVMTRSDVSKGHPEYYRDVAERLAREIPASYFVNQFGNPANAQAHEETTAPEIWEQMGHELHAVVCGVGTGGTLAGLTHFFARVAPQVQLLLADPAGSGLASFATTGKLPAK